MIREIRVPDAIAIELTLQRFAAIHKIPKHSFKVSTWEEFDLDAIAVKLSCAVWSRQIGHQTLKHPKDWKEALKERFAPAWLVRRWPVQYAYADLTAYHAYPGLEIKGQHPHLQVVIQDYEPDSEEL